jgi:hypothetical protein
MAMEAAPHWVYGTKSSFAAGELTPTIEGRTDLPLYQNGAKKIINWIILPSGGLTRRPGTEFVWAIQGSGIGDQGSGEARKNINISDTDDTDTSGANSSGADFFGSSVSISSDSEDDLPPIGRQDELTFVPVAQDPTSRQYHLKVKRDGQGRYFDYGILDEEDKACPASEEKREEKPKDKTKDKK